MPECNRRETYSHIDLLSETRICSIVILIVQSPSPRGKQSTDSSGIRCWLRDWKKEKETEEKSKQQFLEFSSVSLFSQYYLLLHNNLNIITGLYPN